MANTQVTFDSNLNNARSESNIAINPNNPMQVVVSSKKFANIEIYNFTLATEYSQDGGQSWHDSAALAMPGFTIMTDPTLAWDDSGNVFLVGLAGTHVTGPPVFQTVGIVVYKSTDGGQTWGAPTPPIPGTAAPPPTEGGTKPGVGGADKQWAAGDSNPGSPYRGNIYAVWDNTSIDSWALAFMRTQDGGMTWIGAGSGASATAAGSSITTGTSYPEIDVSADGTIYVVAMGADAFGDPAVLMLVSNDGGDTFQPSPTPPATGVTTLSSSLAETDSGFPVFPGGTFRVLTDPTACSAGPTVYVAWADYREGVSRIYYALTNDAGTTWTTGPSGQPLLTGPLPANFQHFHPQIVIDPNGVIGCTFYEFGPKPSTYLIDVIISQSFDHGASFDYFIVTDKPWNPATDAPLAEAYADTTFIGDYFGLDANVQGFVPLWTDTRTGIQELWTAIVPEKGCEFIVNRSTLGQNEIDALRKLEGGDALVKDAFRVIVDGFDAATLGVHSPSSVLNVASPLSAAMMTVKCTGNASTSGGYGPGPQRFTFFYDLDFGTDPSDPAFGFTTQTKTLTFNVAPVPSNPSVSAAGQIVLIKQPDPFMLHGDPPWLSVDLRVFFARPGDMKGGVGIPMGPDASSANEFIQQLARGLTDAPNGSQIFDDQTVFSSDEEASSLYLTPTDGHVAVFNFGLARVRYNGLIGATTVRVFFRLFDAQSTTSIYDYPPGEQYRRATPTGGQPISLAGVIGPDYVTIPFFALPRVDTTQVSMTTQTDGFTDSHGVMWGNIQNISRNASGAEVDTFFGCWLDINQPTKPDGTANNVLPIRADPSNLDGKFTDRGNPPLPIGKAISRALHQCLVAEIAFDPVMIPLGVDTSDSDKLAQRNIAWSPAGSAEAVTTFEIRPTPVERLEGQQPDELMIDWGTMPIGSVASIYLPAVGAAEILSMANRMYTRHGLRLGSDDTVRCHAHGVTYVPIPPGAGSNYAGLLSIETPPAMRRGRTHTVVVRQVTNASGVGEIKAPRGRGRARSVSAESVRELKWRRVIGAFQLTIPVRQKAALLPPEERWLSVLRWIGEAIPHGNRWYPVFHRYLGIIAGRVKSFGGDPAKIWPSPTGDGGHPPGRPGRPGRPGGGPGHPGAGPHPGAPGHPEPHERERFTGKVAGIAYDSFGDFEAFVIETREGERHRFESHEGRVLALVERAWMHRILTTVVARRDDLDRPLEIILHGAPPHEG